MARRSTQKQATRIAAIASITLGLAIALITWFFSGTLVIQGVPSSIIIRFLQDDIALNAYIEGDRTALHDRLRDIGIEDDIKDYYRSAISDEAALDQHIHQIFYDRTGYVGSAYRLTPGGVLVPKDSQ